MATLTDDEQNDLSDHLTVSAVQAALAKMSKNGTLFRCGYEGIVKHFLAPYYKGNIWQASFHEIRVCFLGIEGAVTRDAPEQEEEFYPWVCKRNLMLGSLPRDELLDLYTQASKDLAEIERNIIECDTQIAKIRLRIDAKTASDEDPYDLGFYQYIRDKNANARNEIVHAITHTFKEEALSQASKKRGGLSLSVHFFDVPYPFQWFQEQYDPSHRSDLQNKFLDESISDLDEWERVYKKDPDEFYLRLEQYISKRAPVEAIRELIRTHHRLSARGEVLNEALDAFEQRRNQLFCSAVPLQIEGIFQDYCEDLGIEPNAHKRATLSGKIDLIIGRKGFFYDFEYYKFRFQVFRNKIAHGRLHEIDADRYANLFLLDLRDVCGRITSDDLPVNRIIKLLKMFSTSSPETSDMVKLASVFDELDDVPIFYALDDAVRRLRSMLEIRPFWDCCSRLAENGEPILDAGLKKIAISLKKEGIAITSCVKLLKEIKVPQTELPQFDAGRFWDAVDQYCVR
jgi:hypothetical protein